MSLSQEDALFLENERRRLSDNYKGTIKGKAPMVQGSMQAAYARGLEDAIKMIGRVGFTITKTAAPTEVPSGPAV